MTLGHAANDSLKKHWVPGQHLIIDECMIGMKHRCTFIHSKLLNTLYENQGAWGNTIMCSVTNFTLFPLLNH